jgi:hypothetical protein
VGVDVLVNLLAAVLSLAGAVLGISAIEWATAGGRLRRRVEFLRAELAATDSASARSRTLTRMRDEALARLVAIELVPTAEILRQGALLVVGVAFAGLSGVDAARLLPVGRWSAQDWGLLPLPIAVIGLGLESLQGTRRERERIREQVVDGKAFVPLLPVERRWARDDHSWLRILTAVTIADMAFLVGVLVASRAGYPVTLSDLVFVIPLGSILVLGGVWVVASIIADLREGPISREQFDKVVHDMSLKRQKEWGAIAADPQTAPAPFAEQSDEATQARAQAPARGSGRPRAKITALAMGLRHFLRRKPRRSAPRQRTTDTSG